MQLRQLRRRTLRIDHQVHIFHTMVSVNWVGLVLPFAYLIVLVGSLVTFSSMWRKRIAGKCCFPIQIKGHKFISCSEICQSCALVPTTYAKKCLPFFAPFGTRRENPSSTREFTTRCVVEKSSGGYQTNHRNQKRETSSQHTFTAW